MQEFFQGLECHMILTQTLYGKVSGLVAQRESQALEDTMTLAHNVLKQAHRRGVELEGILEVRGIFRSSYAFRMRTCKDVIKYLSGFSPMSIL